MRKYKRLRRLNVSANRNHKKASLLVWDDEPTASANDTGESAGGSGVSDTF